MFNPPCFDSDKLQTLLQNLHNGGKRTAMAMGTEKCFDFISNLMAAEWGDNITHEISKNHPVSPFLHDQIPVCILCGNIFRQERNRKVEHDLSEPAS